MVYIRNHPIKCAVLVVLAGAALTGLFWLGGRFGWPLAAGLLFALAGAAFALYFREQARRAGQERQAPQVSRGHLDAPERRLQAALQISRALADASAGRLDSRALMDTSLSTITRLVGALGCSYVPVDEWRQPLPAFTFGELPEPVLGAWSAQLASGMLRERCARCTVLKSTPGACPLHPAQLGNVLTVYCINQSQPANPPGELRDLIRDLQVSLGGSQDQPGQDRPPGGVLHLYLPAGQSIDAETYAFLHEMLNQVALAYEAARLRQQEQSTLRQLQILRAPEGEFSILLQILLQGLVQALEADFALTRLLPTAVEDPSSLDEQYGDFSLFDPDTLSLVINQAFDAAAAGETAASPLRQVPVWLALPLLAPDSSLTATRPPAGRAPDSRPPLSRPPLSHGILLVGANHPFEFHQRQRAILQSVAAQAALLVENERLFRSLEYRTVIQERARLAREIHDGLAQTLAFLKLQAAQMQSYLAEGNLVRLSQILKDNYQALAEAYLDTRQAIDDLRLTPQAGLEQWLERILADFEHVSGLPVAREIHPLARSFAPEIQAQLVRIVQEALSNIRKHARARSVRFSLFERDGETVLEITDDGRGFDADDVPDFTRHGLRGMRERAEMLGADFQIISQVLQGTTMRLVLPAFHAAASLTEEPS